MGFIERFFKDAKKIKAKDVLSFISQKIEENMNLDYKDITTYHDPDKLAINVASFANVDGGLIILGVAEGVTKDEKGRTKRIYPEKITWGDVSLEKEKLENQLAARIQPYISGLVVRPIRNKASRVIFLIDIPKSNSAPHMSSDHLYHKRMNFRTGTMEHYEVANLFRINWTMKQKFVESICEPLASILEKHAKSLMEYHCPDGRDFDDILSRTYYRAQMPVELLERINYYIGKVQSLNKEEYFVRESVREIVRKNITNYLREKHGTLGEESVVLENVFVNTKPKKHEIELDSRLAYSLLLTNVSVGNYVSRVHWRDVYEEVSVSYGAETFCIDLHDFDELVWSKCLRETFQNTRIIKMKKSAEALSEEAWDIIDDLIKY